MKRIITAVVLTSFIISGLWFISPEKRANSITEVDLYKCRETNISTSIYLNGNIENIEETAVYLSKTAEIIETYVHTGDEVCKGDLLFIAKESDNYSDAIYNNNIIETLSNMGSHTNRKSITAVENGGQYIVRSADDGIVKAVNAQKGSTIGIGMPCIVIASADEFQVCADVPEDYISDIELGMDCIITGNAFEGEVYHGSIERIMPYATTGTILTGSKETTVDVIVRINDVDDNLKSGYTARIKIETGNKANAVTVPYKAIEQDENGKEYVMKYRNGNAEKVYITTGIELVDTVEILSGVDVDDMIVIEPGNIVRGCMIKARSNENS